MKNLKCIFAVNLLGILCHATFTARADEPKPKLYPLKTCLICGMELGMMGSKPYVFVYHGQEFKVCDESEKKMFDKEPAKYVKQLADAAAKLTK
jgi:YHS domain-containing protein